MSRKRGRVLVELVVLLGMVLFACLTLCGNAADHADTPSSTYRAIERAGYLRGGFGVLNPAAGAPAYKVTTAATYTDGVHTLSFHNPGSETAFILLNATTPSSTNYTFILPPSGSYLSRTQYKVTTISAAASATTSVYVSW